MMPAKHQLFLAHSKVLSKWCLLVMLILRKCTFFFFLFLGLQSRHMEVPWARGQIGATAASLRHSHAGSEPHLRPTPQPMAAPDPSPTEQGQGSNLCPHGS